VLEPNVGDFSSLFRFAASNKMAYRREQHGLKHASSNKLSTSYSKSQSSREKIQLFFPFVIFGTKVQTSIILLFFCTFKFLSLFSPWVVRLQQLETVKRMTFFLGNLQRPSGCLNYI
jgi:hypothetical protein